MSDWNSFAKPKSERDGVLVAKNSRSVEHLFRTTPKDSGGWG